MGEFALTPTECAEIFRKPKGRADWKRSHPAKPGTGPEGETCKSCKHLYRKLMSKAYLKCGLACHAWTGGAGSDVRAGDAACSKWECGR